MLTAIQIWVLMALGDVTAVGNFARNGATFVWDAHPNVQFYYLCDYESNLNMRAAITVEWLGSTTTYTIPTLTGVAGWDPEWTIHAPSGDAYNEAIYSNYPIQETFRQYNYRQYTPGIVVTRVMAEFSGTDP